jgi:hypothetical protein
MRNSISGDRVGGADRVAESVDEDAVGGVADGLLAGGLDVLRGLALDVEDLVGGVAVRRPRVPHRRRRVEEVAGVDGGAGLVVADGVEEDLVPEARDGVLVNTAGCQLDMPALGVGGAVQEAGLGLGRGGLGRGGAGE